MRKQAILIASRKEGEEDINSFENDVIFFKSYLKSPQGGAWLDSEIISLIDPTYKELSSAFKERVDYRFIYFSGHGATVSNKQFIIIDKKAISISRLLNKTGRETAIFDCCRTKLPFNQLSKKYILIEEKASEAVRSRNLYNNSVKRNRGIFIAFVTEKGKTAFGVQNGSYFIHAFNDVLSLFRKADIKGVVSINKVLQRIDIICKDHELGQRVKVKTNCSGKYPFYIGQVSSTPTSNTKTGSPLQNHK